MTSPRFFSHPAAGIVLAAAALSLTAAPADAATTAKVTGGTLTVKGDGTANTVVLLIKSTSPDLLLVDVGGDGTADFSFKRNKFDRISVLSGAGSDTVRIDDSGGIFTDTEKTTIDGGDGADTLVGGFGPEALLGGTGNDLVTPSRGNDVAMLGAGDDVAVWNPGDASDTIEGQGDRDTLRFNGSNVGEHLDLVANGGRLRFTRDVAAIVMDTDDVEAVDIAAVGGADTITVGDLAGTDVKNVNPDLGGADGQADAVVVNGSAAADAVGIARSSASADPIVSGLAATVTVARSESGTDRLTVSGNGGDDQLTVDAANGALAPVTLEGDAGSDRLQVNGGNGAEVFTITPNGTRVRLDRVDPAPFAQDAGTIESIVLAANGGDDTVSAANGLATLVALTIDGGAGADTLTGGDGADVILGGDGNDTITPGRGNDVARLGAGDDVAAWNPGDASDSIEGEADQDTLRFNGANIGENIALSANGGRLRLTRDVAAIVMDTDDVEAVDIAALGGADTITVGDLAGTDVKRVTADLAIAGGGGDALADVVIVDGSSSADVVAVGRGAGSTDPIVTGLAAVVTAARAEFGTDRVAVRGNGGGDQISVNESLGALGPVTLEGGDGADTLMGGSSGDLLSGGPGTDTLVGKGGPDAISGGDGDDAFVWNPGDDSDVLEGDAGADRLKVNGGNGAETFTVTPNGTRVRVDRVEPAPFFQDAGTVETVDIAGNGGDDTVSAGNGLATLVALTIDGGAGNDTITGGDGADTLLGDIGNDVITPGRGNDLALLGPGDDLAVWNPGDASDTIEGQDDHDALRFNGSNIGEKIALSASGGRLRLTRDVAAIVMDADGLEAVDVAALGGADTMTVGDLTGTGVTGVAADLAATGGGGDAAADQVVVTGTDGDDAIAVAGAFGSASVTGLAARVDIAHAESTDALAIETLAGVDSVDQSGLAPGTIGLSVS